MKPNAPNFLTILATVAAAIVFLVAFAEEKPFVYDSAGLRDPMVKPLTVTSTNVLDGTQIKKSRREDIERILAACKIEGVGIGGTNRMTVINDRLLVVGDRVTPDVDIRIHEISRDRIVFILDNEQYTYSLLPPPEKTAP